jgi:Zn-dependent M16 (insulinase) family peptidase
MVNVTGSGETLSDSLEYIGERFGHFGPPGSRSPESAEVEPFLRLLGDSPSLHEVYASRSLQVGFAGMGLPSRSFGTPEQSVEAVLSHQLSTGALWEDIRMKGGAYGAFAYPESLEGLFSFSTYRDPNPLRSLDMFSAILETLSRRELDEDTLEKAIIGAYSKETRPRTGAENGISDFIRFLYGIEESHRVKRRRELLEVSAGGVSRTARRLLDRKDSAGTVILAGSRDAEKGAAKLGVPVKELPV